MLEKVRTGMRVCDVRDRHIGEITGLRGDAFLVQPLAKGEPGIWLHPESIFTVDGQVSLVCDREQLDRYTLPD